MNEKGKIYEKPALKFVSLRNEQAVANTCFTGGRNGSATWYYDTEGTGYVSFQISSRTCTLSLMNVYYYDGSGNSYVISAGDSHYDELYTALESYTTLNAGTVFRGETAGLFTTTLDSSWS